MTAADTPAQLGQADLDEMTSEEIVAAMRTGQLAELLAGNDPNPRPQPDFGPDQLTYEQVQEMAKTDPEAMVEAMRQGLLRNLGISGTTR